MYVSRVLSANWRPERNGPGTSRGDAGALGRTPRMPGPALRLRLGPRFGAQEAPPVFFRSARRFWNFASSAWVSGANQAAVIWS